MRKSRPRTVPVPDPPALEALLHSTSSSLFPAALGRQPVRIDSRSSDGDTPLHVLVRRTEVGGVRRLLDAGADPNALGDMDETPLHVAVRAASADLIAALLKAGARPSVVSAFGQTAAELADQLGRGTIYREGRRRARRG